MKQLFILSTAIILLLVASLVIQIQETTVTWAVKTPTIYEQVWKGQKSEVYKERETTTQRSLLEFVLAKFKAPTK